MKKLALLLAAAIAVCSLGIFSACSNKKPLVGLICLHGDESTYDKNFIDAFKAACKEKGLSDKEYVIRTGIPEDEKCYNAAAELADAGCKAVFADSFGHESHMMQAAEEFPEVQFCHATGTSALLKKNELPNFHNAFASIYEGRYLSGVAAGLKLKEMIANNSFPESSRNEDGSVYMENGNYVIGYVGAYTFAEVISGYTSFYLGVKSEVDNVVMKVKFTGEWLDESGEKTAAEELINNEKSVIISQHADSKGAPTACKNAGVPNVAYNVSLAKDYSNSFLVASKINWQPYFEYMIDCALNDKPIETDKIGGLKDNSVMMTELGACAAEGTQAKLDAVKTSLINGTLKVFDTSKFTVTVRQPDPSVKGDSGLNANATVDENGHLIAYNVTFGTTTENVVIKDGATYYFGESVHRSAPYFDIQIDGIKLLNAEY